MFYELHYSAISIHRTPPHFSYFYRLFLTFCILGYIILGIFGVAWAPGNDGNSLAGISDWIMQKEK